MYITTDTSLAAYLLSEAVPLTRIDYSRPRFKYFFGNGNSDEDAIQGLATDYITGKARVDPAAYYRIFQKLTIAIKNKEQWQY
jgi:hypothetical protein|tara:strand:+ start:135 stop:383 length:249 start_codon:yes stop_codon:yes gene_type:complete